MRWNILFTLSFSLSCCAQGDTLVGVVNGELIKISQSNAGISAYQVVASLPAGNTVIKLAWSATNNCFYTLHFTGAVTNQISRIDAAGNYSVLGPVTIAGGTVYHLEALKYDARTGTLYASASLNGTVTTGDYWSESFIRIDIVTLEATLIGTFSQPGSINPPEADNLAISSDDFLYYQDSQGGGSPFMRFYKQPINMTSGPVLIYEDLAGSDLGGITLKDGSLFFVSNRILRKINLTTNTHTVVGTMFTSANFNDLQMTGLDWKHNNFASIEQSSEIVNSISIFPNPSNGIVNLVCDQNMNSVSIYDVAGKLINSLEINELQMEIDLSDLESGTYFLLVSLSSGAIVPKEIIITKG